MIDRKDCVLGNCSIGDCLTRLGNKFVIRRVILYLGQEFVELDSFESFLLN